MTDQEARGMFAAMVAQALKATTKEQDSDPFRWLAVLVQATGDVAKQLNAGSGHGMLAALVVLGGIASRYGEDILVRASEATRQDTSNPARK